MSLLIWLIVGFFFAALLCRICGKVIDRGEAQTHSLFCHVKDPHFGPPPTTNDDPPMKDSKYKRAKDVSLCLHF